MHFDGIKAIGDTETASFNFWENPGGRALFTNCIFARNAYWRAPSTVINTETQSGLIADDSSEQVYIDSHIESSRASPITVRANKTFINSRLGSGGSLLNEVNSDFNVEGTSESQIVMLQDGVAAPSAVSGEAQIYIDNADGDLKVKFADGVTKTLATDT